MGRPICRVIMPKNIKIAFFAKKKWRENLVGTGERRNFALAFGTEVPGARPIRVITPRKARRFAGRSKKIKKIAEKFCGSKNSP